MIARCGDGRYAAVDAREIPGMTFVMQARRTEGLSPRAARPQGRVACGPGPYESRKPRFRGRSMSSGNRQESRADSGSPENPPSLCHRYREGRKPLTEPGLAAMRPPVSMPADPEACFRLPELITKKRLEIKSFFFFSRNFSIRHSGSAGRRPGPGAPRPGTKNRPGRRCARKRPGSPVIAPDLQPGERLSERPPTAGRLPRGRPAPASPPFPPTPSR